MFENHYKNSHFYNIRNETFLVDFQTLCISGLNEVRQLCVGSNQAGKDSCGGDSGGPMVFRQTPDGPWFQVGIVSFGLRICATGDPAVYTNVSHYMSWIEQNLEP